MDSQTFIAIISAASALAVATIGAVVKGAVTQRAGRDEELRGTRVKIYPCVWRLTAAASFWPRVDLSYRDLEGLHRELRRWYYGLDDEFPKDSPGGLYLSENARSRYGEVQDLIHLVLEAAGNNGDVPDDAYEDLQEAFSAFRTSLTEDLDTRRKRSVWWAVTLRRRHRAQAVNAADRKERAVKRIPTDESASK